MIETHRWRNCYADVLTVRYGQVARSFFNKVVAPSLLALNKQIAEIAVSGEPCAPFIQQHVVEVKRATIKAFALSIQSI